MQQAMHPAIEITTMPPMVAPAMMAMSEVSEAPQSIFSYALGICLSE